MWNEDFGGPLVYPVFVGFLRTTTRSLNEFVIPRAYTAYTCCCCRRILLIAPSGLVLNYMFCNKMALILQCEYAFGVCVCGCVVCVCVCVCVLCVYARACVK